MTKEQLLNFIRQHSLCVIATSTLDTPESALVGFAVTDELEIIFDTYIISRKYFNLVKNPHIAIVIGWDNQATVQYEGLATELKGEDADKYREIYYSVFPDGRLRTERLGMVHFKVTPRWARYSNFASHNEIEELFF